MKTGKYWGSATHRKIINEEKKEVLQVIKKLTEEYLLVPRETTKKTIEDQTKYYKQLTVYKF